MRFRRGRLNTHKFIIARVRVDIAFGGIERVEVNARYVHGKRVKNNLFSKRS